MENKCHPSLRWARHWAVRLVALALLGAIGYLHSRPVLLSSTPIGEVTLTWNDIWPLGANVAFGLIIAAALSALPGWLRWGVLSGALIVISAMTLLKLKDKRDGQLRLAEEMAIDDPAGAAELRRTVAETKPLQNGYFLAASLMGLSVLTLTAAVVTRPRRRPPPIPSSVP